MYSRRFATGCNRFKRRNLQRFTAAVSPQAL
nr:MAG TPA: hypothetical protein [Caudoviricetes sp.]